MNLEDKIIIIKKATTKNIYIRVKDDLKIYVTANRYTTDKKIKQVILANEDKIKKMYVRKQFEIEKNNKFFYLGKEYDIVYTNTNDIFLTNEKVFVNLNYDINKWYKQQAIDIFKKELDYIWQSFPYSIPYPNLTVRSMKTRWGVCNVRLKRITLNLQLIKKKKVYLDYVIIHELCHLIEANHSKKFWELVSGVMPNYKKIRKELQYNE